MFLFDKPFNGQYGNKFVLLMFPYYRIAYCDIAVLRYSERKVNRSYLETNIEKIVIMARRFTNNKIKHAAHSLKCVACLDSYYRFPFALLCVLQSIWQLLMSVLPPRLHAVTWSASISVSFQIRLWLGPELMAQ